MEPEKRAGGIRCIALYDVTKKGMSYLLLLLSFISSLSLSLHLLQIMPDVVILGVKDIVVGRDDGTIEVLVFDHGPVLKVMWKTNINESIQVHTLPIDHLPAPYPLLTSPTTSTIMGSPN